MENMYHCYASAAFGMEGLVAKELKSNGLQDVRVDNGFVLFSSTADNLYLSNMKLLWIFPEVLELAERF